MHERLTASDWVAARGERWRAQLAGMESMLKPIDEPLLGALRLDAPHRVAEVGCGGGGTALEIVRRAPAGTVVHGLDIAPDLVDVARRRARSDASAVVFEVADMATAAPQRAYDRLVSRFGVMFFDDHQAAFDNLARWLEPGGRLAFAVWGRAADNPWMASVRRVVSQVVELPAADPRAPGPFRYAEVGELLALLERAGFCDLEVRAWRGAIPVGGALPPAEAARFALSSFASFGERLARAGGEAAHEAHRALTACFSQHCEDGAVWMDASIHLVTGGRP